MSHKNERPLPSPEISFLPSRSRVYMACVHCRQRRIKCVTNEEFDQPCQRCVKKNLHCEYVPVASGRLGPSLPSTPGTEPIGAAAQALPYGPGPSTYSHMPSYRERPNNTDPYTNVVRPFSTTPTSGHVSVPNISRSHRYNPAQQQQLRSGDNAFHAQLPTASYYPGAPHTPQGPAHPYHIDDPAYRPLLNLNQDSLYRPQTEGDQYFHHGRCTCPPSEPCFCGLRREY